MRCVYSYRQTAKAKAGDQRGRRGAAVLRRTGDESRSPRPSTVAASTAPDTTGISSNENRVSFLSQYGWQVNQDPLVTEELTIPKEMDESYDEYLELQTAQGFDLTKYAGKRVKRYTYEITNYPSGETGVQANLLIYRDKVVGGEVLSPQMNGFVHGLSMPQG